MKTLRQRKLLVVEDSPLLSMETEALLADAGYRIVGPVCDIQSALKHIVEAQIDGAVIDVNLDGEELFTIARELKERSVRFILLAFDQANTQLDQEFRSQLVEKPVLPDKLLSRIQNFFAEPNDFSRKRASCLQKTSLTARGASRGHMASLAIGKV